MTSIPDRPWTRHLMLAVALLLLLSCGAHGIFGGSMVRQVLIEIPAALLGVAVGAARPKRAHGSA